MSEYIEVITNAKTGEVTHRALTESEIAALQPTIEYLSNEIRKKRDTLLFDSDWTQVNDAPVDSVIWAVYRQALRDITSQETFPQSVVWPIPPNEVK